VWRLLRKQGRELPAEDACGQDGGGRAVPLEERAASPHTLELALEAREALRVLASLKERQRKTLALRVAGFSYREIQALRGATYTNVNRHVSEGRAAARRLRDAA
jgi:DNA-directed RNA polymerase specialized sigma24 family protein